MMSFARAGPPRVNDKLQTCPTVYKSGTLVELAPLAFFCQSPDAWLNHGVGLSRDISDPATHHFTKRNGFREPFSNTQCLVCISDSFWKSVSPCHDRWRLAFPTLAASKRDFCLIFSVFELATLAKRPPTRGWGSPKFQSWGGIVAKQSCSEQDQLSTCIFKAYHQHTSGSLPIFNIEYNTLYRYMTILASWIFDIKAQMLCFNIGYDIDLWYQRIYSNIEYSNIQYRSTQKRKIANIGYMWTTWYRRIFDIECSFFDIRIHFSSIRDIRQIAQNVVDLACDLFS